MGGVQGLGTLRPSHEGCPHAQSRSSPQAHSWALAATLALAAPGALSPVRSASAGQYCEPGVKQERQTTVRALSVEIAGATKGASRFRLAQLKARNAYFAKVKNAKLRAQYVKDQNAAYKAQLAEVAALKRELKRARAQLSSCD